MLPSYMPLPPPFLALFFVVSGCLPRISVSDHFSISPHVPVSCLMIVLFFHVLCIRYVLWVRLGCLYFRRDYRCMGETKRAAPSTSSTEICAW